MADTDLWRDRNKVFVAGIPSQADDAALYAKFRSFGEMFQSKVVYDSKTGKSKGFGFITFSEYVNALEAVSQMNQTKWENRVLNVRFLQPKAGGAAAEQAQRRPTKVLGPCPVGCTTIYVGNLAYDITEQVLRKVFEKCGDIKAIRFAEHIETKEFRGFGYVQFYDSAAVEQAVRSDGMIIMGRPMNIDYGSRDEASEKAREELQLKLKKGVCHKFQSGECTRGEECKFAHVLKNQDTEELLRGGTAVAVTTAPIVAGAAIAARTTVEAPNTEAMLADADAPVCINFQKGKCKRGESCRFLHLGATPEVGQTITDIEIEQTEAEVAEKDDDDDGTPMCMNFQKGKCKRGEACRFRHVDPTAKRRTPRADAVNAPSIVRAPRPGFAPAPVNRAPPVRSRQPTPEEELVPICQNFQKGTCKRGESCRFRHVEASVTAAVTPFVVDTVGSTPVATAPMSVEGTTSSPVTHANGLAQNGDDDDSVPVCQNHLKGKCKRGGACRFRHVDPSTYVAPVTIAPSPVLDAIVPETSICKNFQRGRCTRGGSCRFAHTGEVKSAVEPPVTSGTEYQKRFQSVCYNWQNARSCARGDRCPFHHEGAEASARAAATSSTVAHVTSSEADVGSDDEAARKEEKKLMTKQKRKGDDEDGDDTDNTKKAKKQKKEKKRKNLAKEVDA